jgi:hypothetical protein
MARYDREELEQAFQRYWQTGAVGEDWAGFADLFTPDALYLEHVLGVRRGPAEIRAWLEPTMEQYCELYTAYEWHMLDPEAARIVVYMQNRRDHPRAAGRSTSGHHHPALRRRRPLRLRGRTSGVPARSPSRRTPLR